MVCPARVGRGAAFLASIAFVFAPSLASATSFASGGVSVHESRAFAVSGRATLSAAVAAPLDRRPSRPRASLEIFFGRNRLRIHSVAPGAPVSDFRYVLRRGERGMELGFDLRSAFEWARRRPGEVRLHGVEPATNPIPEPTAALLFGAGLCVVGANRSRGLRGFRERSAR